MSLNPLSRRKFLALSAAVAAGSLRAADHPTPNPSMSNNQFAFDLYGQLRGEKKNVFYSPFSITTALAMTAAGAKGKTLTEFQEVLHLPTDRAEASLVFNGLFAAVNGTGPQEKRPYELNTANALWAQKGYPWRKEYITVVNKIFGAAVEDVDYRQPEPARATINGWVEKQTKEKIKDLLPSGSITPETRLVLTNAIYFKGSWAFPFEKEATKDQPFKLADGRTVAVPLMQEEKFFHYGEQPGFQLLELPYKGNELSMVVLLPREANGLAKLDADLSVASLGTWTKAARSAKVRVFLPRFKVEASYTLNDPLKKLGLKLPFENPDFTGMHTGSENLAISLVVHKAFVDVNEEGTEAAAATGVVIAPTAMPMPVEPKIFRADRPFLFLIKHNKSGVILFMGRVTNPKG